MRSAVEREISMEKVLLDSRPGAQDRFLHTRLTQSQPYRRIAPLHAHLLLEAHAAEATKETQRPQPHPSLEREDIVTRQIAILLLLTHRVQGTDPGPESGLRTGIFADDAGKAARSSVGESGTQRPKTLDERGAAKAWKVLGPQRSAVQ